MHPRSLIAAIWLLVPVALSQNYSNNGLGTTPAERSIINQAQTTALLAHCVQAATPIVPENCAITDPSGFLLGFIRMDNAYIGSVDISQKKARTAVLFNGLNSATFGRMAQPGQSIPEIEETNGGLIAFGGGYPIYSNGKLIGGIGVSGGTVPQDEQVALTALKASGFQTNNSN